MRSLGDFFLRAFPLAGSILLAGYCVAYSREYVRRKREPVTYMEDVDDAKLYSFLSKSGKKLDIHNWENKRVYREWEDESRKEK